jgi:hypothetical protein
MENLSKIKTLYQNFINKQFSIDKKQETASSQPDNQSTYNSTDELNSTRRDSEEPEPANAVDSISDSISTSDGLTDSEGDFSDTEYDIKQSTKYKPAYDTYAAVQREKEKIDKQILHQYDATIQEITNATEESGEVAEESNEVTEESNEVTEESTISVLNELVKILKEQKEQMEKLVEKDKDLYVSKQNDEIKLEEKDQKLEEKDQKLEEQDQKLEEQKKKLEEQDQKLEEQKKKLEEQMETLKEQMKPQEKVVSIQPINTNIDQLVKYISTKIENDKSALNAFIEQQKYVDMRNDRYITLLLNQAETAQIKAEEAEKEAKEKAKIANELSLSKRRRLNSTTVHNETGEGETGADEIVENKTGKDEIVENKTVKDETGADEIVENKTGKDETGEVETGTDEIIENKTGEENAENIAEKQQIAILLLLSIYMNNKANFGMVRDKNIQASKERFEEKLRQKYPGVKDYNIVHMYDIEPDNADMYHIFIAKFQPKNKGPFITIYSNEEFDTTDGGGILHNNPTINAAANFIKTRKKPNTIRVMKSAGMLITTKA